MKKLILFCVILSLATISAIAQNQPDAKDALKLLMANGSTPLASIESCKSMAASPEDKTIGDYLAGLLSFQTSKNSKTKIEYKAEKNGKIWVAELMFFGKTDEDVWSMGLRLNISDDDQKLIANSISCIGG